MYVMYACMYMCVCNAFNVCMQVSNIECNVMYVIYLAHVCHICMYVCVQIGHLTCGTYVTSLFCPCDLVPLLDLYGVVVWWRGLVMKRVFFVFLIGRSRRPTRSRSWRRLCVMVWRRGFVMKSLWLCLLQFQISRGRIL